MLAYTKHMRLGSCYSFLLIAAGLSGCGIKQSVCVDDPFQLMAQAYVTNCEGRFELIRENSFYWVSQGEIPSKCDYIEVHGLDKTGDAYSLRQYKNDDFQAASSAEFIVSQENEIELNWLYLSNKLRGETCKAQIDRHREKYVELREKFGPRSELPKDYELIPLEK